MARLQNVLTALLLPLTALAAVIPQPGSFLGVPVANADAADIIPNRYIVVYNNTFDDDAIDFRQAEIVDFVKRRNIEKRGLHGQLLSTEVHALSMSGWRALSFESDDAMILEIMAEPEVAYVEADTKVHLAATVAQLNAQPGLARLSNAEPGARKNYIFDTTAGEDITIYVVDTGVRIDHTEFTGRARWGTNTVDRIDEDENGHGTHVAGTAAGQTYGVAKSANVVAIKVLDGDGSGSNSGVLDGLQFIANDVARRNLRGKAVMNMSLGGPRSNAVNRAVEALHDAGVVCVVAAGNENQDAGNTSPASAPSAITVGAIDALNDRKARFSNHGAAVDVFAAGVNVLSASITSRTANETLSGTSMASPHVAGLAAYLMAFENINNPDQLTARILQLAQASPARVLNNAPDTTGLIANNGNL
ncbi:oryzin [Sodiomyces alkalinus F11]|uniref:Oryzin n=1 Tax=Sodiomyces alkalinus (strain CBS 110278 / VKM F-3762 / F11) TaxID=1314773 RepID=A0A3N2PZP6_SODAK|nr:oryzin [Sodiomyces alkalinus F11]ROT39973.1 oryzin [Sodiomyces alkalinus F11]